MKSCNSVLILAAVGVLAIGTSCARDRYDTTRNLPSGPVYTGAAPPGVIPAGTQLVLRTNAQINTDTAATGQRYPAQVASAIIGSQGNVIVPEGSPAELTVVSSQGGGTFGTPQLALAVRSLTVHGRTYPVVSEVSEREAQREGLGGNRRTATYVGGGAVLGTLIGAIAGGGAGAAIGAATGAAGGAAAQVLTRGDRVRVPAETVLTFRLDEPIRLQGYSG
jgi:hypothetical protein